MAGFQLLLVAGTHGNEINHTFFLDQWIKHPCLLNNSKINVVKEIGNPLALKASKRYIDRDLNRSFNPELIDSLCISEYEVKRAKELILQYGLKGKDECQIAIDLHTTTANMGSSLVIYGRRPTDLALASLMQARLGLPIYLHECDSSQTGFLVESWPCGLVIEIGPVAQSLIDLSIIEKNRIILEVCFQEINKVRSNDQLYPDKVIIYRHLGSIDFPDPKDNKDKISYSIHPDFMNKNWNTIDNNSQIFLALNGKTINFSREDFSENIDDKLAPVFINEASYREKKIAMSITKREVWNFQDSWGESISKLIKD